MFEEINERRRAVEENIRKSFSGDIEKANETDIEKAHQVGDIHPNGKWVWTQLPSGKYDWRTINGRAHKRGQASDAHQDDKKDNKKATASTTKKDDSNKTSELKKIGKDNFEYNKDKDVIQYSNDKYEVNVHRPARFAPHGPMVVTWEIKDKKSNKGIKGDGIYTRDTNKGIRAAVKAYNLLIKEKDV